MGGWGGGGEWEGDSVRDRHALILMFSGLICPIFTINVLTLT